MSWSRRIEEIEQQREEVDFDDFLSLEIRPGVVVTDLHSFFDTCLATVKHQNGKRVYETYLDDLEQFFKLIQTLTIQQQLDSEFENKLFL